MTMFHSPRTGVSRRRFLQTSATAGVALVAPAVLRGQSNGPSQKVRLAFIGAGGRGSVMIRALSDEHVVAVSEVDEKRGAEGLRKAKELNPDVRIFKDYREMLEKLNSQLDGVVVATPDHSHFPAALLAIQYGLHAYVEKPLANTPYELRTLRAAAQKYGVVTQMGNQGHSTDAIRRIREWIQAGLIGPVREVQVWTNRSGSGPRSLEPQPVPDHLAWDLWLGPTKPRPYNDAYILNLWRNWWSFGCGPLGNVGCHTYDAPFWALDLGDAPQYEVEAETSEFDDHCLPKSSTITWRFPGRGKMPPVKVVWHDGGNMPERPKALEPGREFADLAGGAIFYGDRDTLFVPGQKPRSCFIIPETRMQALKPDLPPPTIPRVGVSHVEAWTNAIREGYQPSSNFNYAAPMTETVLMGAVAIRARRPITWDVEAMQVTNSTEANKYLRPYVRDGWNFA